ncbi:hypothetical protein BURMUCGD2M_0833 [Burkholderia multivorans CGD2M]|uniref:Uncharacterized protein n=1 Tax=Burkholderia multivorans CGD2 TaxID=513052 RepID=B9BTS6_9BURK|nr:hypothetical protein BURMUCGD2_0742 [Burkholderia multivorans CGD2]EEE12736.1 hypothetical protein BURMUCGD2M_0833 [Burkholderia multivorans CGD2M]
MRRQARSSAYLGAAHARLGTGRAGGASCALESTVSHGGVSGVGMIAR